MFSGKEVYCTIKRLRLVLSPSFWKTEDAGAAAGYPSYALSVSFSTWLYSTSRWTCLFYYPRKYHSLYAQASRILCIHPFSYFMRGFFNHEIDDDTLFVFRPQPLANFRVPLPKKTETCSGFLMGIFAALKKLSWWKWLTRAKEKA